MSKCKRRKMIKWNHSAPLTKLFWIQTKIMCFVTIAGFCANQIFGYFPVYSKHSWPLSFFSIGARGVRCARELVKTTAVQLKPLPGILGIQLCARALGNRQPVLWHQRPGQPAETSGPYIRETVGARTHRPITLLLTQPQFIHNESIQIVGLFEILIQISNM